MGPKIKKFLKFSSVFRYFAIRYPRIHFMKFTPKTSFCIILITWFLSAVIGLLPLFGWNKISNSNTSASTSSTQPIGENELNFKAEENYWSNFIFLSNLEPIFTCKTTFWLLVCCASIITSNNSWRIILWIELRRLKSMYNFHRFTFH